MNGRWHKQNIFVILNYDTKQCRERNVKYDDTKFTKSMEISSNILKTYNLRHQNITNTLIKLVNIWCYSVKNEAQKCHVNRIGLLVSLFIWNTRKREPISYINEPELLSNIVLTVDWELKLNTQMESIN